MEKINYLIEYLLKESGRENFDYSNRDKKSLYRALVNVRQAKPISDEFLEAEDSYLQEELKKYNLIRFNKDTRSFLDLTERFIEIQEDIKEVIK